MTAIQTLVAHSAPVTCNEPRAKELAFLPIRRRLRPKMIAEPMPPKLGSKAYLTPEAIKQATARTSKDERITREDEIQRFRVMDAARRWMNLLWAIQPAEQPVRRLEAERKRLQGVRDEVRNRIVVANLPLGIWQAGGKVRRGCKQTIDELASDSFMHLLTAAEKFRVERGLRFSSFATACIRFGFITEWRARMRFIRERQMAPSANIEDRKTDDRWIKHELEFNACIEVADTVLDKRERRIIQDRLSGVTLEVAAGRFKISKERARQIQVGALRKIVDELRARGYEAAVTLGTGDFIEGHRPRIVAKRRKGPSPQLQAKIEAAQKVWEAIAGIREAYLADLARTDAAKGGGLR